MCFFIISLLNTIKVIQANTINFWYISFWRILFDVSFFYLIYYSYLKRILNLTFLTFYEILCIFYFRAILLIEVLHLHRSLWPESSIFNCNTCSMYCFYNILFDIQKKSIILLNETKKISNNQPKPYFLSNICCVKCLEFFVNWFWILLG